MARMANTPLESNTLLIEQLIAKARKLPEATAAVNVIEKTIDANGEYVAADEGVDGYSKINVDVPTLDTSDATATADDIVSGATAYANGEKITGNITLYKSNEICSTTATSVTSGLNGELICRYKFSRKQAYEEKATIDLEMSGSLFGDAIAEDVAEGKTFTSSSGYKIVGKYTPTASGVEVIHITDADTIIEAKTSGTVMVWGYVNMNMSTNYSATMYTFVGDGYYKNVSYGTPSKTEAVFAIDADGKLSGLPEGTYAEVNILITIGDVDE